MKLVITGSFLIESETLNNIIPVKRDGYSADIPYERDKNWSGVTPITSDDMLLMDDNPSQAIVDSFKSSAEKSKKDRDELYGKLRKYEELDRLSDLCIGIKKSDVKRYVDSQSWYNLDSKNQQDVRDWLKQNPLASD